MSTEKATIRGHGTFRVLNPDGSLAHEGTFTNTITDTGDEVVQKLLANVSANRPTGMRLGTGTTAAAKNGAGAAIVTYLTGSNLAPDATYPTAASKGAGLGWRVTYRCTWAAGVATNAAISEAVITNETPLTNVAGSAADTVARTVFSPVINKAADQALELTWNLDYLGS